VEWVSTKYSTRRGRRRAGNRQGSDQDDKAEVLEVLLLEPSRRASRPMSQNAPGTERHEEPVGMNHEVAALEEDRVHQTPLRVGPVGGGEAGHGRALRLCSAGGPSLTRLRHPSCPLLRPPQTARPGQGMPPDVMPESATLKVGQW